MIEVWRPIAESVRHEVSNLGRVRSVDCIIDATSRWGGPCKKRHKGRVLRDFAVGSGYRAINVALGSTNLYVHRLVAQAFLPLEPGRDQINHKDGDKANNAVANLERVTGSENQRHRTHVLGKTGGQFVCRA